jgi:hypothetical protein
LDRLLSAAAECWRRAGGVGRYHTAVIWPFKPKGMQWRTYERLREEHDRLKLERDALWVGMASRRLRRMGCAG